ncbi:amidase domain-containing protein [Paenibacillus sp. GCM10023252]|uniref:amidase domain-containing protein n=1 Tax=Paenibacillus sp. GCM10023252 TaxID=3252649 RepID=UPI00361893FE
MPRTGNRRPGGRTAKRQTTQPKPQQHAAKAAIHSTQVKMEPREAGVYGKPASSRKGTRSTNDTSYSQSELHSSSTQAKPEGWKAVVHQYVKQLNQAETDQHVSVIEPLIGDSDHCIRLQSRLERLRERELLRGALPTRSETRAELIRVNESRAETSILLKLHIRKIMDQGGRSYTEERSEYERLWLQQTSGTWHITRIEPLIAERRPRYGTSEAFSLQEEDSYSTSLNSTKQEAIASVPFLNYDLISEFKHRTAGIRYRRDLAAAYADRWWNEANPAYELFEVNCTSYVSQCIFAGNAPMNYTGKRESGWWYKGRSGGREWWSYSWAVSNALSNYLSTARKSGLRAEQVYSAEELQLGDVITYDWNGDNRYQHSTIVTAFDSAGMPLVNANTVASRHRYWDYQDSYAYTPKTKYRFLHIVDLF